ncbi:DUF58 domain-containing protein [Arthrobacter russicus]|jgi:uncharacterized protein (DUF58 family)|uniref:Uncharacterized protein (DUF58 family) n=1 Tax=Arthrobacter russicus TaxID=172040 RepID=A0ABU1J7C2_9MICC|nr:DUF58 domain-containing protein [Arthrobacter russicus]MDR6268064.1 uncharacterized protein (DUF58 family) [Arthrobacter russicus]
MATLLQKVKSKMFIFAHRKAHSMLDGEYAAVFRGRSLDFDDLRGYVPGDEVRDIDWKATARHGSPLIRRYVAVRKQTVLLLADTGRNMAAVAKGGESKKELTVLLLGVLGYLALKHGDQVALVHGDASGTVMSAAKGGEAHLESLLQTVDRETSLASADSELTGQLDFIAQHVKTRTLLIVVADELAASPELAGLLRRLRAQHEILWLTLEDADLRDPAWGAEPLGVQQMQPVMSFLASEPGLAAEYGAAVQARRQRLADLLGREGISAEWLGHSADAVPTVFRLLERHRRAGK